MAVPKKHKERIEKFIRIILEHVISEKYPRNFYKTGALDNDYQISISSNGTLPKYNDDRIEINGDINGKKTEIFIIPGAVFITKKVPDDLVNDLTEAFLKLRVK